jgi:hypothetical protein
LDGANSGRIRDQPFPPCGPFLAFRNSFVRRPPQGIEGQCLMLLSLVQPHACARRTGSKEPVVMVPRRQRRSEDEKQLAYDVETGSDTRSSSGAKSASCGSALSAHGKDSLLPVRQSWGSCVRHRRPYRGANHRLAQGGRAGRRRRAATRLCAPNRQARDGRVCRRR